MQRSAFASSPWIRAVSILLAVYGAFTGWLMIKYQNPAFLAWAIPCFVAAAGLATSRSWSQYLVYLLAFFTIAGWAAFALMSWPRLSTGMLVAKTLGLGA